MQTPEDLIKLKREMSAKYNMEVDSELLPFVAEMMETRQTVNDGLQSVNKTLEAATLLLHKKSVENNQATQQTGVRLTTNSQAFWHGFGKWGIGLTSIALAGLIGFLFWFYREQERQKAYQIATFLQDHQQLIKFQEFAKHVQLDNNLIRLYPSKKNEAVVGQNFTYNPACKCIEIPLK